MLHNPNTYDENTTDKWLEIINKYKKEFNLKDEEIKKLSQNMAQEYTQTINKLRNENYQDDEYIKFKIYEIANSRISNLIINFGKETLGKQAVNLGTAGVIVGGVLGSIASGGLALAGLGISAGAAAFGSVGLWQKLSDERLQSILVKEFSQKIKEDLEQSENNEPDIVT